MQMQSPAPSFEIPAEMRAFAERSFEQARIAFDKFMETAQSTMNTLEGQSKVAQAGAKEISQKIKRLEELFDLTLFDRRADGTGIVFGDEIGKEGIPTIDCAGACK